MQSREANVEVTKKKAKPTANATGSMHVDMDRAVKDTDAMGMGDIEARPSSSWTCCNQPKK